MKLFTVKSTRPGWYGQCVAVLILLCFDTAWRCLSASPLSCDVRPPPSPAPLCRVWYHILTELASSDESVPTAADNCWRTPLLVLNWRCWRPRQRRSPSGTSPSQSPASHSNITIQLYWLSNSQAKTSGGEAYLINTLLILTRLEDWNNTVGLTTIGCQNLLSFYNTFLPNVNNLNT